MDEQRWERLGAATGIIFFVLTFIAALGFDAEFPSIGSSGEAVRAFYDENASKVGMQSALGAFGVFFFFWWVGVVRSRMATSEGVPGRLAGIAFGGGVATALLMLCGFGIQAQVLLNDLSDVKDSTLEVIPSLLLAGDAFVGVTTVTRAVLFGAMALATLRFNAFPKWTGWISGLFALGSFVGTLAITGEDSPFGYIWFFSWMGSFFWILIMSIVMTVKSTSRPAEIPAEV